MTLARPDQLDQKFMENVRQNTPSFSPGGDEYPTNLLTSDRTTKPNLTFFIKIDNLCYNKFKESGIRHG